MRKMERHLLLVVLIVVTVFCQKMEAASVSGERGLPESGEVRELQMAEEQQNNWLSTLGQANRNVAEERQSGTGSCDFETDLCSWTQSSSDTFDFTRSYYTPSGYTGPAAASSGSYFIYIEASSPRVDGDFARLESPQFSAVSSGGRCMRFDYSMNGRGMGHLRVIQKTGSSEKVIWHRDGIQDMTYMVQWQAAHINLQSDVGYQLIIEASVGPNYQSDIAVDDIRFEETACYAVPVHCGANSATQKRIKGGEASTSGKWPWQMLIRTIIPGTNSTQLLQCGGTLIDPQWVLSAAHCVEHNGVWITDPGQMRIYFGELDVTNWEESQFSVTAEYIKVHESRTEQGVGPYDILLIKLPAPVSMSEAVNVACLPDATDVFTVGTPSYVSGWGKDHVNGSTSDVLMHVDQELFDLGYCAQKYGSNAINEDMLCAGRTDVIQGGCKGDSGGPLVCQQGDYYTLLGVVSFGAPCGQYNVPLPGVYASVQYFLSWIESTIQAN